MSRHGRSRVTAARVAASIRLFDKASLEWPLSSHRRPASMCHGGPDPPSSSSICLTHTYTHGSPSQTPSLYIRTLFSPSSRPSSSLLSHLTPHSPLPFPSDLLGLFVYIPLACLPPGVVRAEQLFISQKPVRRTSTACSDTALFSCPYLLLLLRDTFLYLTVLDH